jgi:hypothetical protein
MESVAGILGKDKGAPPGARNFGIAGHSPATPAFAA